MALYYLTGEKFNLLQSAFSFTSTSEDPNYPRTNLSEYPGLNDPSNPFRFASVPTDGSLTVQFDEITNFGFETDLTGWNDNDVAPGVSDRDTVIFQSGVASLKCNGGTTGAGIRAWLVEDVPTGGSWRLQVGMYGSGTVDAKIVIRDYESQRYLKTDATWQDSFAYCLEHTDASWVNKTIDFTLEDSAAHGGQHTTSFDVQLRSDGNGQVNFDNVLLFPGVNFMSVHGHNFQAALTPEMRWDDAGFAGAGTLAATMTPRQPSFYAYLSSMAYHRWWRLLLSGTNQSAHVPYIGELVLGQAKASTTPREYGWVTDHEYPQVRFRSAGATSSVSRITDADVRTLRLPFRHTAAAAYLELRNELWRSSRGGETPIVIVPYSGDADVIHGRVMNRLATTRSRMAVYQHDLIIEESGFPTVGL